MSWLAIQSSGRHERRVAGKAASTNSQAGRLAVVGKFLLPLQCSVGMVKPAMGFAVSLLEGVRKPPVNSALMTPGSATRVGAPWMIMLNALWIFIGGGLGSVARWWISGLIASTSGQAFPWGTLVVNVSGSFAIGLFATLTGPEGRWLAPASFRQFFMLGICGGYTTFSSFSLQTLNLAEEGEWLYAAGNILWSVVSCLLAVWLGHLLAQSINH